MRLERVFRHQLIGHLFSKRAVQSALLINGDQLCTFRRRTVRKLRLFLGDVRCLGIGLRTDRDIFPRRHRHRACDKSGRPCQQHGRAVSSGGGHTEHEAGCGNNAVIGTKDRCPQPTDPFQKMRLGVSAGHRINTPV